MNRYPHWSEDIEDCYEKDDLEGAREILEKMKEANNNE